MAVIKTTTNPVYGPRDLLSKGVTGVTDSRKPSPDAGFGRHTLVFQGVTASPLGVTDLHLVSRC